MTLPLFYYLIGLNWLKLAYAYSFVHKTKWSEFKLTFVMNLII